MQLKKIILVLLSFLAMCNVNAQEYCGTTGLLQVPSAETDAAGTFRGGASFLHRSFLPSKFSDKKPYNTAGYHVGITACPWLQLSYSVALLKTRVNGSNSLNNEDRSFNVKFRPLKEGGWWPAIALGWDDLGTRLFKETDVLGGSNNYFLNIYGVATKHFDIKGWELGTNLAYRYYPSDKNKDRRGLAGGISVRPSFYRPLRFIAEWDGIGINVGTDVLLLRHLFLQAALIHAQGFTGGVSYHYVIPY